jgi:hypothetical protein
MHTLIYKLLPLFMRTFMHLCTVIHTDKNILVILIAVTQNFNLLWQKYVFMISANTEQISKKFQKLILRIFSIHTLHICGGYKSSGMKAMASIQQH